MKRVIIRIIACFAGAALLTGCFGEYDPHGKQTDNPIGFRAGTLLLCGDATRTATLKEAFAASDSFAVFALLNNNTSSPVFDNTHVGYNGTRWSYDRPQGWAWSQNEDWYDFIAVAPETAGAARLVGAPGRLTVTVPYNVATQNYDLLAATHVRLGSLSPTERVEPVPFVFKHMLTAVRVDAVNISGEGNFTLNSYCFKNVNNSATLKATITSTGRESFLWIDAESSSAPVRTETPANGPHNPLSPGDTLRGAGFNLFIPQPLNESVNLPALEVTYTPASTGVPVTSPLIELQSIRSITDGTPITEWQMGVKYIYEIRVRLDGGVEVRVKTVDWDKEVYETPGIMIPE